MAGEGALFTREDAVEAAWTVVDAVLAIDHRAHPYKPGTWGPKQAEELIAPDGRRHNPRVAAARYSATNRSRPGRTSRLPLAVDEQPREWSEGPA